MIAVKFLIFLAEFLKGLVCYLKKNLNTLCINKETLSDSKTSGA